VIAPFAERKQQIICGLRKLGEMLQMLSLMVKPSDLIAIGGFLDECRRVYRLLYDC